MLFLVGEPNWTQVIAVGGVSLLILLALSRFFKESIWPLIRERVKHQEAVDDNYREALMTHIKSSHEFMSDQLKQAQTERTTEIRLFLGEVAKSNQASSDQRREFLAELDKRDRINEEQTRLLRAIAEHLKLDASPPETESRSK